MSTDERPQAFGGDIRVTAMAYFFSTIVSAAAVSAIGVRMPRIAETAPRDETLVLSLIASFILAAAIVPLARGLQGRWVYRWFTLAVFTYVGVAVINVMQGAVFSTFNDLPALLVLFAPPSLVLAGAAASFVHPVSGMAAPRAVFVDRPMRSWWWRPLVAIWALPVIEGLSGLLSGPLLEDALRQQDLSLIVPSGVVILQAQLMKSVLLLGVTIPIICAWKRSRRHLVLALGPALFILTGFVGMVQASWWPVGLRVVIAAQVLLTSTAYAVVIVELLMPRTANGLDCERPTSSTDGQLVRFMRTIRSVTSSLNCRRRERV